MTFPSPDRFRRVRLAEYRDPTPVLLRGVFYDPGEGSPGRALRTYPALVLYGGPTTHHASQTPAAEALRIGLDAWAWQHTQKHLAIQWVAVAPSRVPVGEPPWPHSAWRWWYQREPSPQPEFELRQTGPATYAWRPVAMRPYETAGPEEPDPSGRWTPTTGEILTSPLFIATIAGLWMMHDAGALPNW